MDILEIPIELQTRIFINSSKDVLVVNPTESFIIKIIDNLTILWRTCYTLRRLPPKSYKECQNWGYDEIQAFVFSQQLLEG